MKIIIKLNQKELSHQISVLFSGRKLIGVEANSSDDASTLLQSYPEALLLTDEMSGDFYEMLDIFGLSPDIYLLCDPNTAHSDVMKLQKFTIKAFIPYVEDAMDIVDALAENLSLSSSLIKKEDKSVVFDSHNEAFVAIYLKNRKAWVYTELLGFNSSKVSIKIENTKIRSSLVSSQDLDYLRMFIHGGIMDVYADLVFNKDDIFVFRYRMINQDDQQRLAYYINYCQQQLSLYSDVTTSI